MNVTQKLSLGKTPKKMYKKVAKTKHTLALIRLFSSTYVLMRWKGRNRKPKANFSLDLRSLRHISYFANIYHNIKEAYVKVRKSQKSFFLSSIPPKDEQFFLSNKFLPYLVSKKGSNKE